MKLERNRYLLNELHIEAGLLKIYCISGLTRNDNNFTDPPRTIFSTYAPIKHNSFRLLEIYRLLQERPTFTFRCRAVNYN